jgi:hypothetical protein
MAWVEVFSAFVVCHLAGDYLLQTDHQARHKHGGLGPDPVSRRALLAHIATYTLAFVPALVWLAGDLHAGILWVAALIALPHFIQDDGRLIERYVVDVKGAPPAIVPAIAPMVDQAFHFVALFGLALLAGS